MPTALPRIRAIRYVTPLREGGSLPGVIEADNDGTYAVKLRGAGQGLKVLLAEVIVGQLARHLGIRTPDLAVIELSPDIARYEADEEVQDLLTASHGSNLAVDLLPGAFGYDGSRPPTQDEATRILWLDALTANVDRTWSNPNLLVWHRQVWVIDHGAALYFHHTWPTKPPDPSRYAAQSFSLDTHVLREVARPSPDVHHELSAAVTHDILHGLLDLVPDEWLEPTPWLPDPEASRTAYVEHLSARLANPNTWWVSA